MMREGERSIQPVTDPFNEASLQNAYVLSDHSTKDQKIPTFFSQSSTTSTPAVRMDSLPAHLGHEILEMLAY